MENLEKMVLALSQRVTNLEQIINKLMQTKEVPQQKTSVHRDKTKFMFEGSVYAKNRLVLAVVTKYVGQNKAHTYNALQKVFDKSLQGSLGVVEHFEVANKKTDAKKRYFMNHPLTLKDATVVVCTQWGAFNINKFILRAKELGFKIIEVQ
jgi:hypothetical protein